jgi:DNA replication and repair protein RecF
VREAIRELSHAGPSQAEVGAVPAAHRLAVRRLTLAQFRCFEHLRVDPDERPIVLTGPTGAGKTTILEAISLFAPGRGMRGARLSELQRRGAADGAAWAVAATLDTAEGPIDIGTGQAPPRLVNTGLANSGAANADSDERGRRVVRIDGRPVNNQSELARHLGVVWLTPAMDRLFRDGAEGRRRFLDRLAGVFDPAHVSRVSAYERAVRERLRLLMRGPADPSWLAALEETIAANGVAVAALRLDIVERLSEEAGAVGRFPGVDIEVVGDIELSLRSNPAVEAEARFREALASGRRRDAETGRTGQGTHRSDMAVTHRERDMPARLCSTGEQKALLVAILLAHARLLSRSNGASPILLLDEVAAHLDRKRRESVFEEIAGLAAQAWMTGTDETTFEGLRGSASFLHIGGGGASSRLV